MDPPHMISWASPDVVVTSALPLRTVRSHRQGLALVLVPSPKALLWTSWVLGPWEKAGWCLGQGRQLQGAFISTK